MACEIHHLTVGGLHGQVRRGHDATIGLCAWHHRGVPAAVSERRSRVWLGPSYALEPAEFRSTFGDDDVLMAAQSAMIEAYQAATAIKGRG
jgi:hypothetical protein